MLKAFAWVMQGRLQFLCITCPPSIHPPPTASISDAGGRRGPGSDGLQPSRLQLEQPPQHVARRHCILHTGLVRHLGHQRRVHCLGIRLRGRFPQK